jgi:hypothetical protein
VEIVTVAAQRSSTFSMSDTGIMVGGVLVAAVLAWMLLTRMRRGRNQRHA